MTVRPLIPHLLAIEARGSVPLRALPCFVEAHDIPRAGDAETIKEGTAAHKEQMEFIAYASEGGPR